MDYEFLFKLLLSVILGGVIGIERERAHKAAGFRTNILIVLGSMLFTVVSLRLSQVAGGMVDPGRIAANVATGIGFLGAGGIIRTRGLVHGLTTAACIWVDGAIGLSIGVGLYFYAAATTIVTILVLFLFGYLENYLALKRPEKNP